jgi:L-histidine N-alpha-methyltransferase
MLAEVAAGLSATQKELPPKYFYDHRGSELFEEITRLPEYYLTRAERVLLEGWMPQLIRTLGTRTLVELGAGSAEKSRIILNAMRAAETAELYVPIDVSAAFLRETADQLRAEYPGLTVTPAVADISEELNVPRGLAAPVLFAFLGSTIGNFHPAAATRLLARVRAIMWAGDRFLMGADLRKDIGLIEAAYNDSRGVTAEFNRNMLRVLNHELGADFDLSTFTHRAFYDRDAHRIEMHLISTRRQAVDIPGIGEVRFAQGESIRTEISCKYDIPSLAALFSAAGLQLESWQTDPDHRFALVVGKPV